MDDVGLHLSLPAAMMVSFLKAEGASQGFHDEHSQGIWGSGILLNVASKDVPWTALCRGLGMGAREVGWFRRLSCSLRTGVLKSKYHEVKENQFPITFKPQGYTKDKLREQHHGSWKQVSQVPPLLPSDLGQETPPPRAMMSAAAGSPVSLCSRQTPMLP